MNDIDPSVSMYPAFRSNAMSVRCVKDWIQECKMQKLLYLGIPDFSNARPKALKELNLNNHVRSAWERNSIPCSLSNLLSSSSKDSLLWCSCWFLFLNTYVLFFCLSKRKGRKKKTAWVLRRPTIGSILKPVKSFGRHGVLTFTLGF